jgi:hypothetical protein
MKLIGSLAPVGVPIDLSINAARPAAGYQIIAFLVATFLFSLYGVIAIIAFRRASAAAARATALAQR